jgi:hypothetical protein
MTRILLSLMGLILAQPQPAVAQPQPVAAQTSPSHAPLGDPDGEPIVVGSIHRIRSSVYGTEQTITVRLPRGYRDAPQRRCPVLFSVDGGPDQDFELLAGIAAEAEHSTSYQPFILIGIKTEDRYSQLTPEMTRLPIARLRENFGERDEAPEARSSSANIWSATSSRGRPAAIVPGARS